MNKKRLIKNVTLIIIGIILFSCLILNLNKEKIVLIAYDDAITDKVYTGPIYVEEIYNAIKKQNMISYDYVQMTDGSFTDRVNYAIKNKYASLVVSSNPATKYEMYLYAKNYTDVTFINMDATYEETLDNLTGLDFDNANTGYIAGYIAGLTTKTNNVAVVAQTDSELIDGFYKGAMSSNNDVTFQEINPITKEEATISTQSLFDNNVDVIFDGSIYYSKEVSAIVENNDGLLIGLEYSSELNNKPYMIANINRDVFKALTKVIEDYTKEQLDNNYTFSFNGYLSINYNEENITKENTNYIQELIDNLN